jgi:hypothetical protein
MSRRISARPTGFSCYAQRYSKIRRYCRDALELDANAPITDYLLGGAYAIAGAMPQAISTLEPAVRLAGWFPAIEACLGSDARYRDLMSSLQLPLPQ